MQEYFRYIKNQLHKDLLQSASGYIRTGLQLFHDVRKTDYSFSIQPSIGNLGIAIELMLKAFIVKNNPILLFTNKLPLELKILFTSPSTMPNDFKWRNFDIDIKSFSNYTIDLKTCIDIFYVFFPKYKQHLYSHFDLLSKCRNASIHASLPSFQRYELERIAYLTLRVIEILNTTQSAGYFLHYLSEKDKKFLSTFKTERIERVQKKVEAAKERSKKITNEQVIVNVDDWESYITDCPICGSNGILAGYTDVWAEIDEDEHAHPYLDFFADTFDCRGCGLALDDPKELRLAGMDINYDRSVDMDKWTEEHVIPNYDDMS